MTDSIEPRLRDKLDRQAALRDASAIPVVVQLDLGLDPSVGATYAALAARLAAESTAVLAALHSAGFGGDMERNVLAGTLAGRLTPPEIAAIADLPQVRRIVHDRRDAVSLD